MPEKGAPLGPLSGGDVDERCVGAVFCTLLTVARRPHRSAQHVFRPATIHLRRILELCTRTSTLLYSIACTDSSRTEALSRSITMVCSSRLELDGTLTLRGTGECKQYMQSYLDCLRKNTNNSTPCRHLNKDYLECRMARCVCLSTSNFPSLRLHPVA